MLTGNPCYYLHDLSIQVVLVLGLRDSINRLRKILLTRVHACYGCIVELYRNARLIIPVFNTVNDLPSHEAYMSIFICVITFINARLRRTANVAREEPMSKLFSRATCASKTVIEPLKS